MLYSCTYFFTKNLWIFLSNWRIFIKTGFLLIWYSYSDELSQYPSYCGSWILLTSLILYTQVISPVDFLQECGLKHVYSIVLLVMIESSTFLKIHLWSSYQYQQIYKYHDNHDFDGWSDENTTTFYEIVLPKITLLKIIWYYLLTNMLSEHYLFNSFKFPWCHFIKYVMLYFHYEKYA